MNDKFYALLRLGLGVGTESDRSLYVPAAEWPVLYRMAEQQALLGIVFAGVQCLGKDSYPPRPMLLQWIGKVETNRHLNQRLIRRCAEVTSLLEEAGLDTVVLKGQAVARYYPGDTGLMRSAGDIDVLVRPKVWRGSIDRSIHEVRRRVAAIGLGHLGDTVHHHQEWHLDDVPVELHFRLMTFFNPFTQRRLERWQDSQWSDVQRGDFNAGSDHFNAVYLLAHFFHHLIGYGIGIRQMVDYYVVLTHSSYDNDRVAADVRMLGMQRFAGGVMWAMQHIFGFPEEKMFARPDEKEGRLLLDQFMRAGNLGRYDTRFDHQARSYSWASIKNRFILRTPFLGRYPGEILWDVPFRLYNYCWRKIYG